MTSMKKLGRGINFGNMFESPRSGGWGTLIEEYFFEEIADKGFQHIRIPIRWSEYALNDPPYTIEEAYMDTIKATVDLALKHNLLAIINIHHYDEIFEDPDAHQNRFVAIWIRSQMNSRITRTVFCLNC
jgi:endoglucanase